MLVLSRQLDETIMIGDEIEISIIDIRGDKVRLGINAPGAIAVHRKEIYEAIRNENRQAARADRSIETELLRAAPRAGPPPTPTNRGSPSGGKSPRSAPKVGPPRPPGTRLATVRAAS